MFICYDIRPNCSADPWTFRLQLKLRIQLDRARTCAVDEIRISVIILNSGNIHVSYLELPLGLHGVALPDKKRSLSAASGRINNYAVQLRYQASSLLASLVTLLSDQLRFCEEVKVLWRRKPFIRQKINWRKIFAVLKVEQ